MTVQISKEAQTVLEWAFGAYADKDPGIPFDIARAVDTDAEPTREVMDALAKRLINEAVVEGAQGRLYLGWCTFQKEGRFGIGVMALQRQT